MAGLNFQDMRHLSRLSQRLIADNCAYSSDSKTVTYCTTSFRSRTVCKLTASHSSKAVQLLQVAQRGDDILEIHAF